MIRIQRKLELFVQSRKKGGIDYWKNKKEKEYGRIIKMIMKKEEVPIRKIKR